MEAVRYSEDLSQYYMNELVPMADQIYRFAYALTLNAEGAMKLTEWSYIEVTSELDQLKSGNGGLARLLSHSWSRIQQMKSVPWKADESVISRCMQGWPLKARAMFAAVDILGLTINDVKEAFSWDDKCLDDLALARRGLVELNMT
jgi:hypothetical protein